MTDLIRKTSRNQLLIQNTKTSLVREPASLNVLPDQKVELTSSTISGHLKDIFAKMKSAVSLTRKNGMKESKKKLLWERDKIGTARVPTIKRFEYPGNFDK